MMTLAMLLVPSATWDKYMLSPGANRTVLPRRWFLTHAGAVPPQPSSGTRNQSPSPSLPVRLQGKGASLTFDWGQETGGFTTLRFGGASDAGQSVSLAYSESSLYWMTGDDSSGHERHIRLRCCLLAITRRPDISNQL